MTLRCTKARGTARAAGYTGGMVDYLWPRMASLFLLLSLAFSGVVPQGMMRVAGEDGVRLVLCTEEGPRDLWLAPDGSMSERAPLPEKNHEVGKCLAVGYAFAAVQAAALADPGRADFALFRPVLTSAHWPGFTVDLSRAARAPPFSTLA